MYESFEGEEEECGHHCPSDCPACGEPAVVEPVSRKVRKTPIAGGRSPKSARIVHCFCDGREHNHGCPRGM